MSGATKLFLSSEGTGDMRPRMGTAHYSYRVVAAKFACALERRGYAPVTVKLPEKFKRAVDLTLAHGEECSAPIHLAFRSPENIRPMPVAALNICHFAWEFEVLKDRELISGPITANQKHMLGLMDEIWVPCRFTLETLRRYGLSNVECIPTPVIGEGPPERMSKARALETIGAVAAAPLSFATGLSRSLNAEIVAGAVDGLARFPALAKAAGGEGRIFLTICNPHDLRKNLLNAIDGFVYAAEAGDVLIVKFIVPGGGAFLDDDSFEHLAKRYRGPVALSAPNVLAVSEYLDESQMRALYSLADFYLSASHCEGFNLPLLEAMAHGALPVTTRNTAMRDYIDDQNALIIAERMFPGAIPGMPSDASGISAMLPVADRFDIARAIRAAQMMRPEEREARAARARARVVDSYGENRIMNLVEARFAALRSGLRENRDAV